MYVYVDVCGYRDNDNDNDNNNDDNNDNYDNKNDDDTMHIVSRERLE